MNSYNKQGAVHPACLFMFANFRFTTYGCLHIQGNMLYENLCRFSEGTDASIQITLHASSLVLKISGTTVSQG